jgi:hypothetical protein
MKERGLRSSCLFRARMLGVLVSGGEVAYLVAGVDGGVAEPDQDVALAGARRTDDRQIVLGTNPFQAGQVVDSGLRDRGGSDIKTVDAFGDGERGGFEPVGFVGRIAGGDLGLDQGAQHFLGGPALCLGGQQDLGGTAAHRRQLEPPDPSVQIGGKRRNRLGDNSFRADCGAHEALPSPVIL